MRLARRRWLLGLLALLAVCAVVVFVSYETVPTSNTNAEHFDCILVLGSPAKKDGRISARGRWLVNEAVGEYQAGRAPFIVFSGAAVANQFAEAEVLAHHAMELGVPTSAIIEDREARNTLQNVENAAAIMKQRGWTTVEVVGINEHLHRTAVLLQHTSLQWVGHPAATPGRSLFNKTILTVVEAVGTAMLRVFGLRAVPVLHVLKTILHWG